MEEVIKLRELSREMSKVYISIKIKRVEKCRGELFVSIDEKWMYFKETAKGCMSEVCGM